MVDGALRKCRKNRAWPLYQKKRAPGGGARTATEENPEEATSVSHHLVILISEWWHPATQIEFHSRTTNFRIARASKYRDHGTSDTSRTFGIRA
jgi:hypothetical protein